MVKSNGQAWASHDSFCQPPRLCRLLCGDTPSLHPLPPTQQAPPGHSPF